MKTDKHNLILNSASLGNQEACCLGSWNGSELKRKEARTTFVTHPCVLEADQGFSLKNFLNLQILKFQEKASEHTKSILFSLLRSTYCLIICVSSPTLCLCMYTHLCTRGHVHMYIFFPESFEVRYTCLSPLFLSAWRLFPKKMYIFLYRHRKGIRLNKFNIDTIF